MSETYKRYESQGKWLTTNSIIYVPEHSFARPGLFFPGKGGISREDLRGELSSRVGEGEEAEREKKE